MRPFAEYREYLASDEYKQAIKKLLESAPSPPRQEYAINYRELADRHRAHAGICIEGAARHMRKAQELEAMQ